jgi:Flp pilus assembly protein TadG
VDEDGVRRGSWLGRFARADGGATALEYGLVLPLFILMLMGGIWAGLLTFSQSCLEMAVQSAARCLSVNSAQCATPAAAQAYALARYAGPAISPSFTASNSGCGHTVTGQATFDLNIVPGVGSVPLSASACYP